jgi:glycerol-3-phosphate dehydrogenase
VQTVQVDIAIIGGGVAGLWLLNRARDAGYHAIVLERDALGSGQTVASQGMIHGGVKYTLSGALSGASEAIADMPAHWQHCLRGEGDVDLRGTRVLSEHFYMWSTQGLLSKATTFFASKALRGRVETVKEKQYPPAFSNKAFRGSVYQLVDSVIDAPSLLETLRTRYADCVLATGASPIQLQRRDKGADIVLQDGEKTLRIRSQLCVLSAGKGNGELLQQLHASQPAMQLRPLQQVLVKHPQLTPLYAHCVGTDSKPRLTISSHTVDGEMVWYLGGQLAEEGAQLSRDNLLQKAKAEMSALFSWIDWNAAQWATYSVDRAEPQQPGLLRPDNAWLSPCDDLSRCLVAWPTKLTLAPNLGNLLMHYVQQEKIVPRYQEAVPDDWPRMKNIAATPWQAAQQHLQWRQV